MSSSIAVHWSLKLLGCWGLEREHQQAIVAFRQQRLIAALALKGGRRRSSIAGLLWPDCTEVQASGSLRACLWNIAHQLPGLLEPASDPLSLAQTVSIDVAELTGRMDLVNRGATIPTGLADQLRGANLLPGWHEEWLWPDQERLNRLRIATLENLAGRFLATGQLDAALEAATTASELDPLRESAQRMLLRIHLAAGNNGSAIRSYRSYLAVLGHECGVRPSAGITDLIRPLLQVPQEQSPTPPLGAGLGVGLRPSFD
ncbi:BTAD domain-containing putative transcriptional regulator [Arthrobacter sp. Br18]|uniref:AfsR/SARP family transcriptional regulator n=1 Tax=Arthrobacter sp. Br18 TaxID=1312954 RepID=UPI00068789AB|nr:BTAD domain-containing putative transcriptional regulator [Arthrobacter sp. Br18]